MVDGQTYRYIDKNFVSQSDGQIESQSDRQLFIQSFSQLLRLIYRQMDGKRSEEGRKADQSVSE